MINKIWKLIISFFDSVAKIAAGTVAIIALLSFYPPFAKTMKFHYSKNLNPTGYVRYKVNENYFNVLGKSQLRAVKSGDRSFKALKPGDILQVISKQNFRESPETETSPLLVLQEGDCVVVLKKDPSKDDNDGWLKVATASCGFFD